MSSADFKFWNKVKGNEIIIIFKSITSVAAIAITRPGLKKELVTPLAAPAGNVIYLWFV